MKYTIFSAALLILALMFFANGTLFNEENKEQKKSMDKNSKYEIDKSNSEWKKVLTSEQYRITREKGTEPAFSGKYNDFKGKGVFKCVCCGNELFSSDTKYNSGSGWPSFWAPIPGNHVDEKSDRSFTMERTEVVCDRCGAHLGHVFEDGPQPTGLRYCINSAALKFEEKKDEVHNKTSKKKN